MEITVRIVPAAGEAIVLDDPNTPVVVGEQLINDISGVLHRACRTVRRMAYVSESDMLYQPL